MRHHTVRKEKVKWVDVKVKCIEQGKTQAQVAKEIDTTRAYVNRVIKRNESVVNNTFVRMMDALGYDIELHYVKKEESNEATQG